MSAAGDPATILVVEDDLSLNAALMATLKAAGFRPVSAKTGAEGMRWLVHYRPELVLLDLGLPDRDGLGVIRDIRAAGATPIVVLSARGAEAVKVAALDLGADDYLSKPFGVEELLARVRAGLRHGVQARGSTPVVRTGGLEVDLGRRLVRVDGEGVKLSPKEYDVLAELALNLGQPVSHRALLRAVWGREQTEVQYLRVYVGQLRRRLRSAGALVLSEQGVGYRLEER